MMMSGPLPTLAATAALGRTSSQPSLSTRTSTPVFSVNFLVFAIHMSSSPWTKRFQRSTRSFAPFSGVQLRLRERVLRQQGASRRPSNRPRPRRRWLFRKSRLVNFDMSPPRVGVRPYFG